jgi:hypothetical protein
MNGGGITIREMEDVARSMGGDIGLSNDLGNVIDITDSSDALGLNMLMNQAKVAVGGGNSNNSGSNSGGYSGGGNTISIAPSSSSMGGIELSPLEPLEPITLNMDSTFGAPPPVEISFQKEQSSGLFGNSQTATGPSISLAPAQQQRDPVKEKQDKIEYLNKLQRLEQKGFPVARKFTMDNSLDEIKQEYDRLVDARNLEGSLRFQRQALMGVVTGLEWMNNRFDPFDLNLEGWSESVHENVEDFDEIFEELYDKYKDRGKMPPEARLLFSLAGSGFMVHVSNTFMKQRMPSAADVLKNNPELARQFAAAAANQAGSGFGNFMGMAMGAAGGGPQPQMQMPSGPQGMSPEATTGAFFGSSARPDFMNQASMPNIPQVIASVEPSRQTARKEMKGPSGVDDILKTFEEVRRQEVMGGMSNGMEGVPMMAPPMMNTMVAPPPMNQPAMAAVMEMESIASGDIGSTTESTRTGGGRRRRKAAIQGNTLTLNV